MPEVAKSGFSTRFYPSGSAEFPILLEHYEIHGIIGEGGMGRVFKAYHLNLKRFVAIKTLRIDHHSGSDLVGRFKQEMELVGQMDHPNVVRASDAGEKNGIFYLVMEYLSGCDLSHLATRKGRLESPFACELISQAALGLDYIHEKTLIHRDIKPSNLMLTSAGQLKILDLGLARFDLDADRHEKTPNGYAVGTYAYMAPEQATAGRKIDGRTDIYSLGCTLFKLLTGRTPYSASEYDNVAKVLNAHNMVPLSEVEGFVLVPENLRGVLLKMTAKDPDHRYRTGREVAEALLPHFGEITGSAMQPHAVSVVKEDVAETPIRPLTDPLPEELSRLTGSVHETPQNTRSSPPTSAAVIEPKRPRKARRWAIVAGVLAPVLVMALLVAAFFHFRDPNGPNNDPTPDPNKDRAKQPETARPFVPRNLDVADPGTIQFLLDQPPLPVGYETENNLLWFFNKKAQQLDLRGGSQLVFPLGTTRKSHYNFATMVSQSTWGGYFGIFWGYREVPHLKLQKNTEFAWFQMLVVEKKIDMENGDRLKCVRGTGAMSFNHRWDLQIEGMNKGSKHEIKYPAPNAIVPFEITIRDDELIEARFVDRLVDPCSRMANDAIAKNYKQLTPYKGAVGVFSQGADVRFSGARFIGKYSK